MNPDFFIQHLGLISHPEGGHFREHYRSDELADFAGFSGPRSVCTSIYFLLKKGEFSALHRIKSDEIWHFYQGDPLEVVEIEPNGYLKSTLLGANLLGGHQLSYVVKAGNWFGSRPAPESQFSLVGCTVSPGFDFNDFEMPGQEFFLSEFPQCKDQIVSLTR